MKEQFYIAGFKFHEGMLKIEDIDEDDTVTLVPDPDNPYDENAIEVQHEGDMIGFVPKAVNQNLTHIFEKNSEWPGSVIESNKETAFDEPWKAVKVQVTDEEEA